MKYTLRKKWINCLLAIILLLSGICFDTIQADSSISYTQNADSTETCSLLPEDFTKTQQDICTSEQLKTITLRGAASQLNRYSLQNKGKSRLGTGIFLSALNILSENSNYYFKDVYIRANRTFLSCEAVIISYIHHQDGTKGNP